MQATTSERLYELLCDNSLTAFDFAKQISVSFSVVAEWIRENTGIKLFNLLKIAKYFDCSVDFICGRTDNKGIFYDIKPTFPNRLFDLIKNSKSGKNATFENIGMNRHALYDWKKGTVPLSTSLIIIANYFDCSVDYLIGIEN